ncbi:hypothetical protein [Haliangium sp.]|uniref:NHL domain-containing protein n=1 Tax=Haliangium sp. TaxID=2663208 RepID=UPI003D0B551E
MRTQVLLLSTIITVTTGVGCSGDDGPGPDAAPVDAAPTDAPTDAPIDAADIDATPLPPLGPGAATLSGGEQPGVTDGPRGTARFNNPVGVAVGPDGNIYVTDFDNSLVRRVTPDGEVTTLVDRQDFVRPFGITFAPDGTLYVQTDGNDGGGLSATTGTIWEIDTGDGSAQVVARDVGRPRGLAALSDGRLVLVDYSAHYVQLLDPSQATPAPTPLAGSPGVPDYADGNGTSARFNRPLGVVVADNDDIYLVDSENHCLRKLTIAGEVTTVTGTPQTPGSADGTLAEAGFNLPYALAQDSAGSLYLSEQGTARIRKLDLTGDAVTTIAGTGTAGYQDAEDPLQAQFFGLEGMDTDGADTYLYITDGNRGEEPPDSFPYHRVRRLSLP